MRASLGNSLLLNMVVFFAGIIMLLFVGIISYSKAYGVKNRIVNLIEEHEGYTVEATQEIDQSLNEMGYSVTGSSYCDTKRITNHIKNISKKYEKKDVVVPGYNYCVYEIPLSSSLYKDSKYYVVVTFVNFNFPLIGNMLNIPIYGETKILGKTYDY